MIQRLALTVAAFALLAAAPVAKPVAGGAPTPVPLAARPRTALDATARRLAAADLQEDPRALVLIGSAPLGRAATGPALFVQIQSQRACGSAGCATSVFLPTKAGWSKVLDAVSGQIVVAPTEHAGMRDLVVGRGDRFVWNGTTYADTEPTPQIDLRPRTPPVLSPPGRGGHVTGPRRGG